MSFGTYGIICDGSLLVFDARKILKDTRGDNSSLLSSIPTNAYIPVCTPIDSSTTGQFIAITPTTLVAQDLELFFAAGFFIVGMFWGAGKMISIVLDVVKRS